jgi:group I intron endonuclease
MSSSFDLQAYKHKLEEEKKLPIYGVVYLIRNKKNDKGYVGQTTQKFKDRFVQHCNPRFSRYSILTRAIKKYGVDNFEYCILGRYTNKADLDKAEIDAIIALETLTDKHGYNIKLANNGSSVYYRSNIAKSTMGRTPWNKGMKMGPSPNKGIRKPEWSKRYKATCLVTGEETIFTGSKIPGFNSGHIIQCCKGKLKHHKGFKWEYYNE